MKTVSQSTHSEKEMALQSIRYGGGVWKQHEELRVRLEAKVDAHERELAQQRQQLLDSQEANASLHQELQTSRSRANELDELLEKRSQEAETLRAGFVDANQRQADSERRIKQLQHELNDLSSICDQQQELLSENTSRIAHLELQVDASKEEELRLCELLYAEQEKNEAHEAQLVKQQRELRILTRANRVKSAQSDALIREKAELAQMLAKLRDANPKVHFVSPSAVKTKNAKKHRVLVQSKQQRSLQDTDGIVVLQDNQRDGELDGAVQSAPTTTGCGCCGVRDNEGFLWKELQLLSAKLRSEQRQSAQLRDQIAVLETSKRALMVRFREAAAARQRAEKLNNNRVRRA